VEINPKVTGLRIKSKRKEIGLTQKTLGEQVGVSAPAINRFERGDKSPSIETLLKLAKALGTSTDYLLGAETIEGMFLDPETSEAFKVFTSLSRDSRQLVLSNIQFLKERKS